MNHMKPLAHAVLFGALIAVAIALLAGCAQGSTPKAAMEHFVTALQKGDYHKAWGDLSKKSQQEFEGPVEKAGASGFKSHVEDALKSEAFKAQLKATKIVKEEVKNGKATVTLEFPLESKEPYQQEMILVKEKGAWKVSL
ncbi:MAG: DUF4878 domain-containing protein [Candidatus Eremiobacteraeota bacterium]|nr:DUF4878 domain-containing protein [Candidatus Eremiobacteraeota bacterium]